MTPDRLDLARAEGLPDISAGRTLVLRAQGDLPVEGLGEVTAWQGFRPDHDRLAARGIAVAPELTGEDYDTAIVQITKSRDETLALVHQAFHRTRPGGLIIVDGQKDEGIEAALKALRRTLPVSGVVSKSHGKLIWAERPETLPDLGKWEPRETATAEGFVTVTGGFSPASVDTGSMLMVEFLPQLSGRVADLGAGWGYLGIEALKANATITELHLIEADHAALAAARQNVSDSRAVFHWADATRFAPDTPYDAIICNPPFHQGRRADPRLGQAFIQAAATMLTPQGRLILVANRHLPYEASLKEAFATGSLLAEAAGFKLYLAERPRIAQKRKLVRRA